MGKGSILWTLFRNKVARIFVTGIFILGPVGATLYLMVWIFQFVDSLLRPVLNLAFGAVLPGTGFVFAVATVLAVGLIAESVIGKSAIGYGQAVLSRIPIVRPVYNTMKQIADAFSESGTNGFTRVVLVEFPRKGMRAVGFVTNETQNGCEEKLLSVYVPGSPNPTSGFFQIVRESEAIPTKLSVSEAMKIVISAGKLNLNEATEDWPKGY